MYQQIIFLAVAITVGLLLRYFQNRQFQHLAFGVAYRSYFKPKSRQKYSSKWKPSTILHAIYKTAGTGVIAISGKIAGTVFCAGGQQGPFIRVWAKPRNRRTAAQNFVRGMLSGIATSWRTLTTAQADAWNSAGSGPGVSGYNLRKNVFGDTRKISGSQLFQRVGNILLGIGLTAPTSPPITGTTDAILSATTVADASAQTILSTLTTFGAAVAVPALTYCKVYATPQKGANQSYFGDSDYRYLAFYPPTTAINPLDITVAYLAQFGALSTGSKIGLKFEFIYRKTSGGDNIFSKGGAIYETVTVVP